MSCLLKYTKYYTNKKKRKINQIHNCIEQVSRLWKDQVGSFKGLWLAQARRIGCQVRDIRGRKSSLLSEQEERDWGSLSDEWTLQLHDSSPDEEEKLISGTDWKKECVAGLKLRNLLDSCKAWTHEELVNLVKAPGRCLYHQSPLI